MAHPLGPRSAPSEQNLLMEGPAVVTTETPAEFLKSRKGAHVLLDPFLFEYLLNKEIGAKRYWYCREKKSSTKCPATAVTVVQNGSETILFSTAHSHFSDPTAIRVKKTLQTIKETASANPEIKTADLMTRWATETSDPMARGQAPKFRSVQRAIQKSRASTSPWANLPNSPEFSDLDELPDFAQLTSDGKTFLISNMELDDGSRILIFASDYGLSLLARSETWLGDGTFQKAPKPFFQIYSLLALVDGKAYPALFSFLPNKRSATYQAFLEEVKSKVAKVSMTLRIQHGNGDPGGSLKLKFRKMEDAFSVEQANFQSQANSLKLKQFCVDFESHFIKELTSVFGKDLEVSGCWNHLKRNLWAHARSLPYLQSYCPKSEVFSAYLKSFGSLAFVPAEEIYE